MARIKTSTLAGRWYAGEPSRLRAQVDGLLQAAGASTPVRGPLLGLVVPHAGYQYSGQAAAVGYAALAAAPYRRAIILAPSHFSHFRGAAVLEVESFETPLGLVAVDTQTVAALVRLPLFSADARPYREEHSLEIQLPFLQRVLPDIQVVPILLGDLAGDDYETVAAPLRELDAEDTVFIASSDFVHYGADFGYLPFPPAGREPVRAALRTLDMGAIERVCAADAAGFRRYIADTGATICGRVPISVLLTLPAAPAAGRLLTYYSSLDVTGDYEHCVSYASIAFPRARPNV